MLTPLNIAVSNLDIRQLRKRVEVFLFGCFIASLIGRRASSGIRLCCVVRVRLAAFYRLLTWSLLHRSREKGCCFVLELCKLQFVLVLIPYSLARTTLAPPGTFLVCILRGPRFESWQEYWLFCFFSSSFFLPHAFQYITRQIIMPLHATYFQLRTASLSKSYKNKIEFFFL
jgi:hypothetical protein